MHLLTPMLRLQKKPFFRWLSSNYKDGAFAITDVQAGASTCVVAPPKLTICGEAVDTKKRMPHAVPVKTGQRYFLP